MTTDETRATDAAVAAPISRLQRTISNTLAVAYKEATVLRHDRALIAMVVAQPLIMLFLFGVALSNKPANVPWAVMDRSQTSMSRRLIEEIHATGYFLEPTAVGSYDEGQALLRHGKTVVFLVLPSSLRRDYERGHPQVQLLVDGSDPLTAARVAGYMTQVAAGFSLDTSSRSSLPLNTIAGRVDLQQRFRFNRTLADRDFFMAVIGGMLLTNFCLSVSSLGLVGERESGTYEQMLSLPTRSLEIVLGKLLPYVGVSYGVTTFTLLAGGLLFDIWPVGSWAILYLVTLPFVLTSLAAGAYVSTVARTSAQAVFISVFFILPSFVLSGTMFPYQLMPDGIRHIGGIFPLRWYQIAVRRIFSRGGDFGDVLMPFLCLCAMFLVLLVLIQRRMKPRLG